MKHEDIERRGLMLVLSSPSGAGKTTLSRLILAQDTNLRMSVSATTRTPRPGEVEGRDYYFVDHPTFEGMVERGEMLEHATVFGNRYGTPAAPVHEALAAGHDVLFDIDWQGTQQVAQKTRDDLVSVFILPPDKSALRTRLMGRAQDPDEVIAARMSKAADEMSHYAEYEYIIVNDDLDESLARLKAILTAERLKRRRMKTLPEFVATLRAD
ncbi:guanylate kinase [Zavarzinia sp. CC-PAN008]|uniref:guanylate kinase n=1 Tax=Zavarzinia sp. CC-PAN008 TaxID=3243332 RepID=UPI003F745D8A